MDDSIESGLRCNATLAAYLGVLWLAKRRSIGVTTDVPAASPCQVVILPPARRSGGLTPAGRLGGGGLRGGWGSEAEPE